MSVPDKPSQRPDPAAMGRVASALSAQAQAEIDKARRDLMLACLEAAVQRGRPQEERGNGEATPDPEEVPTLPTGQPTSGPTQTAPPGPSTPQDEPMPVTSFGERAPSRTECVDVLAPVSAQAPPETNGARFGLLAEQIMSSIVSRDITEHLGGNTV